MSVPNLKRIAVFVQQLIGGSQNFEIRSRDPGIGVRGPECFYDGAIRWSIKFSDTFSRFDTIPAVTDSHPATQPASHVAVAITLNAKASSLKKRNKNHPSNYRPISLPSIICKIMESIVRDTIMDFSSLIFFSNNLTVRIYKGEIHSLNSCYSFCIGLYSQGNRLMSFI